MGLQGSIFKFGVKGLEGRYNVTVNSYDKVGNDYFATNNGDSGYLFPPMSLDAFDPEVEYWMGGGDPLTDLLVIWNAMDIGVMRLVTKAEGFLAGVPSAGVEGPIRCQYVEDQGGGEHFKVLWEEVGTDEVVRELFGFVEQDLPAPQLDNGIGNVLATAERPPQGVYRPEYLPSDDSLPQTPVIVGKARTMENQVEVAFYGVASDVRVFFWEALFERVVVTASLDETISRYSLQQLLRDVIAPGYALRFYLREELATSSPDDYWQGVGTPPFTADFGRSRTDASRLKWQWRIELSEVL